MLPHNGKRPREHASARDSSNDSPARSSKTPAFAMNKTSSYFTRSPSSAVGSAKSLGSLAHALSGHGKCYCYNCRKNPTDNEATSTSRVQSQNMDVMDAISTHFHMCPYFNNKFWKGDKELEATLSLSASHLCRHNCYLRAFAPAREWHTLRATICHYANVSPDQILFGWSCYLAKATDEDSLTGLKPKVVFVSSNGMTFDSGDQVLKSLGFMNCSTQRTKGKGLHCTSKGKGPSSTEIVAT